MGEETEQMDGEGMAVVSGAAEEIRNTAIDPTTAAPASRPDTASSRERRPTVLQTVGEHGQIYRLTNGAVKYRGATLLVLQCPEAYCSEAALRGHFEAIVPGQVERVEVRPAKRSALVHFRSQTAAATALRRGHTTGDQVSLRLRYFIPLAARQALRRHQQDDQDVEEESRERTPEPTSTPPPPRSETAAAPSSTARRARPWSTTTPDETVPLVGTCQDMCPEEERRARESQRDLHPFEITSDAQGVPRADPHKTVKKFARSAAGAEAVRAENVRTPATLVRTMDYLMHRVLDRDDVPLHEVHAFVRDRTRSIRQDFTYQGLRDAHCVAVHERAARFHILSEHRLAGTDPELFSSKQNLEQLDKCLVALRHMYREARLRGTPYVHTEGEFHAYHLLMHTEADRVVELCRELPASVLNSAPVQWALRVVRAMRENDFVAFFGRLLRRATFLQACLMERHFGSMRLRALSCLGRALARNEAVPVAALVPWLALEDEAQATAFLRHHGVVVEHTPDAVAWIGGTDAMAAAAAAQGVGEHWVPTPSVLQVDAKAGGRRRSAVVDGDGDGDTVSEVSDASVAAEREQSIKAKIAAAMAKRRAAPVVPSEEGTEEQGVTAAAPTPTAVPENRMMPVASPIEVKERPERPPSGEAHETTRGLRTMPESQTMMPETPAPVATPACTEPADDTISAAPPLLTPSPSTDEEETAAATAAAAAAAREAVLTAQRRAREVAVNEWHLALQTSLLQLEREADRVRTSDAFSLPVLTAMAVQAEEMAQRQPEAVTTLRTALQWLQQARTRIQQVDAAYAALVQRAVQLATSVTDADAESGAAATVAIALRQRAIQFTQAMRTECRRLHELDAAVHACQARISSALHRATVQQQVVQRYVQSERGGGAARHGGSSAEVPRLPRYNAPAAAAAAAARCTPSTSPVVTTASNGGKENKAAAAAAIPGALATWPDTKRVILEWCRELAQRHRLEVALYDSLFAPDDDDDDGDVHCSPSST